MPKLIKPAISLGKNILAPPGLSAVISATDAGIQKKIHGYGNLKNSENLKNSKTKTIKFTNDDLNDMTKIVKALEDSDVSTKGITKTLKNDIKKGGALPLIPMLLGTLGTSLVTGRGLL